MKVKNINILSQFEQVANKLLVVQRTGGNSGLTARQIATVRGLGLRGINSQRRLVCTRDVFGMLQKVKHVINIQVGE
jgi:ribosomal protein L30/L7E